MSLSLFFWTERKNSQHKANPPHILTTRSRRGVIVNIPTRPHFPACPHFPTKPPN